MGICKLRYRDKSLAKRAHQGAAWGSSALAIRGRSSTSLVRPSLDEDGESGSSLAWSAAGAWISTEMVIWLETAFRGGAEIWLRMQAAYDLAQAKKFVGKLKGRCVKGA